MGQVRQGAEAVGGSCRHENAFGDVVTVHEGNGASVFCGIGAARLTHVRGLGLGGQPCGHERSFAPGFSCGIADVGQFGLTDLSCEVV